MTEDHEQAYTPAEVVDAIERTRGRFPGYRRVHARGLCCTATFQPNGQARAFTVAPHLQDTAVAATVRFSHSDTDPHAPDAAITSRGFAVKFHLADGRATDLVSVNFPVFFASTIAAFVEFTEATALDPATGAPDPVRAAGYAGRHPEARPGLVRLAQLPAPVSYATSAYWPIHAFWWVNTAGRRQAVRYQWTPGTGTEDAAADTTRTWSAEHLTAELGARLAASPITFTLEAQLAAAGDPTDDPTLQWPADRPRLTVGTLTITAVDQDQDAADRLIFDPTNLIEGIEPSADPILVARRHFYGVSYQRRTTEQP